MTDWSKYSKAENSCKQKFWEVSEWATPADPRASSSGPDLSSRSGASPFDLFKQPGKEIQICFDTRRLGTESLFAESAPVLHPERPLFQCQIIPGDVKPSDLQTLFYVTLGGLGVARVYSRHLKDVLKEGSQEIAYRVYELRERFRSGNELAFEVQVDPSGKTTLPKEAKFIDHSNNGKITQHEIRKPDPLKNWQLAVDFPDGKLTQNFIIESPQGPDQPGRIRLSKDQPAQAFVAKVNIKFKIASKRFLATDPNQAQPAKPVTLEYLEPEIPLKQNQGTGSYQIAHLSNGDVATIFRSDDLTQLSGKGSYIHRFPTERDQLASYSPLRHDFTTNRYSPTQPYPFEFAIESRRAGHQIVAQLQLMPNFANPNLIIPLNHSGTITTENAKKGIRLQPTPETALLLVHDGNQTLPGEFTGEIFGLKIKNHPLKIQGELQNGIFKPTFPDGQPQLLQAIVYDADGHSFSAPLTVELYPDADAGYHIAVTYGSGRHGDPGRTTKANPYSRGNLFAIATTNQQSRAEQDLVSLAKEVEYSLPTKATAAAQAVPETTTDTPICRGVTLSDGEERRRAEVVPPAAFGTPTSLLPTSPTTATGGFLVHGARGRVAGASPATRPAATASILPPPAPEPLCEAPPPDRSGVVSAPATASEAPINQSVAPTIPLSAEPSSPSPTPSAEDRADHSFGSEAVRLEAIQAVAAEFDIDPATLWDTEAAFPRGMNLTSLSKDQKHYVYGRKGSPLKIELDLPVRGSLKTIVPTLKITYDGEKIPFRHYTYLNRPYLLLEGPLQGTVFYAVRPGGAFQFTEATHPVIREQAERDMGYTPTARPKRSQFTYPEVQENFLSLPPEQRTDFENKMAAQIQRNRELISSRAIQETRVEETGADEARAEPPLRAATVAEEAAPSTQDPIEVMRDFLRRSAELLELSPQELGARILAGIIGTPTAADQQPALSPADLVCEESPPSAPLVCQELAQTPLTFKEMLRQEIEQHQTQGGDPIDRSHMEKLLSLVKEQSDDPALKGWISAIEDRYKETPETRNIILHKILSLYGQETTEEKQSIEALVLAGLDEVFFHKEEQLELLRSPAVEIERKAREAMKTRRVEEAQTAFRESLRQEIAKIPESSKPTLVDTHIQRAISLIKSHPYDPALKGWVLTIEEMYQDSSQNRNLFLHEVISLYVKSEQKTENDSSVEKLVLSGLRRIYRQERAQTEHLERLRTRASEREKEAREEMEKRVEALMRDGI